MNKWNTKKHRKTLMRTTLLTIRFYNIFLCLHTQWNDDVCSIFSPWKPEKNTKEQNSHRKKTLSSFVCIREGQYDVIKRIEIKCRKYAVLFVTGHFLWIFICFFASFFFVFMKIYYGDCALYVSFYFLFFPFFFFISQTIWTLFYLLEIYRNLNEKKKIFVLKKCMGKKSRNKIKSKCNNIKINKNKCKLYLSLKYWFLIRWKANKKNCNCFQAT